VGGVDRIDDPALFAIGRPVTELFSENAVVWIARGDPFAKLLLDGGIGLCDVALIGLLDDVQVATKMLQRDPVGRVRELGGKGDELVAIAQARILSPLGS
jgi:hypothetical protein